MVDISLNQNYGGGNTTSKKIVVAFKTKNGRREIIKDKDKQEVILSSAKAFLDNYYVLETPTQVIMYPKKFELGFKEKTTEETLITIKHNGIETRTRGPAFVDSLSVQSMGKVPDGFDLAESLAAGWVLGKLQPSDVDIVDYIVDHVESVFRKWMKATDK